ncbi:MAG: inositol monophosphatase family protein [Alphaproteobacteria bacterium]|nr:inositol monophosphatase family protein [Alphaproteobacteria bacterium]
MTIDYEKQFKPFIDDLADAAGEIALKYFRSDLAVEVKQDQSPVTIADKTIEKIVREKINKTFPSHGIIGEEFGRENDTAEFVWVLDPIDGTKAFMTGKPMFGTIIGLMHNGKPAVGCIDQAFTKERWFGIDAQMATHNNAPIKVAKPRTLAETRLYAGLPDKFWGEGMQDFLDLCHAAKYRQYNCDCYAFGLVAMGCADILVEAKLQIYDVAGCIPVITGAGGFASDWDLKPVGFDFSGEMLCASTKELAEEAVRFLKRK